LLVITELFLPTKGGTAVWAAEVYKRLGGKEIHIVTAQVPDSAKFDLEHPNNIHRIDLRRVPWLRPESLAIYLRLFAKSFSLAITHRFDAVHAFRALPEGLVGWIVARLSFRPLVTYAHGEELTTWGSGGKFRAMRFVLRHSDKVIANSEHTRDTLLRMEIAANRITLIYPGVDVDVFRPGLDTEGLRENIGVAASEKLVFSVGRLQRRKGFDHLIDAVAQLRSKGLPVVLAIAGIGDDREFLRARIEAQAAQRHMHLLGAVGTADLPRWMNACDVLAMPNREIDGDNEGFGMVFIEAAACGKAVVAGLAGGTGAAVIDGVTGLRVDGRQVERIAQALEQVLFDEKLARAMGDAALRRARAEFAWAAVAAKTLRVGAEIG
jgi:phosphatidylinositol alpha-1,6-mannosyltransferase